MIKVWEQRSIYGHSRLSEFRAAIGDRRLDSSGKGSKKQRDSSSASTSASTDSGSGGSGIASSSKRLKTIPTTDQRLPELPEPREGLVIDPESLVRALRGLESAASRDKEVREKIAKFPPEVTDPALIERSLKASGGQDSSGHLARLQPLVEEACILLSDYNHKLSQEMEDRKKIAVMLATFVKNQKDRLSATEASVREFKEKLASVAAVRSQLRSHLSNLPDLSLLPSVMAPLPSAGDLFNVHNVHVTDVRLLQRQQQEQEQLDLQQQEAGLRKLPHGSESSIAGDSSPSSTSPSSTSPATSTYSPADHGFPTPKS